MRAYPMSPALHDGEQAIHLGAHFAVAFAEENHLKGGLRVALHEGSHPAPRLDILVGKPEEDAIHDLERGGLMGQDGRARSEGLLDRIEVKDERAPRLGEGADSNLRLGYGGEGALRADQKFGEVEGPLLDQLIEIVARHPPHDLREAVADLLAVFLRDAVEGAVDPAGARFFPKFFFEFIAFERPEGKRFPAREKTREFDDMVHRLAVDKGF